MTYSSYHIPINYTDAGRLFGFFEIRNTIEAALLTVPVLYLCLAYLPFELATKISVTLFIAVPLAGFALIGVSDDSLSHWLTTWFRWRRSRRLMLYRGEVRQ